MANKLEFVRGDGNTHTFNMPAADWSAGGKLFFAAKPAIDDDLTDANAVIEGVFDDNDVVDLDINGSPYKSYTCYFPPNATNSIISGGATKIDYKGEFQFVPLSGAPITYPYNDKKIDTIVYFDIKRETM